MPTTILWFVFGIKFKIDDWPLITELPKPDVEPISSVSEIGSEAIDDIDEKLSVVPVDSMMEAFEIMKM